MDPTGRLIVTKRFTYQGVSKEYANSYYFNGDLPDSFEAWSTFATDVIDLEKTIFASSTHLVKAVGFDPAIDFPVYTETFDVAGTLTATGASSAPGDCAMIARYTTDQRDTLHKPIYAYNYYHGCIDYDSGSGHPDGWLYEPQKSALEDYAAAWIAGIDSKVRSTPKAATTLAAYVDPWIRHRDFPR